MPSQSPTRSKEEIEKLIGELYAKVGGNPGNIHIKPHDGGWHNVLTYEITRNDGAKTSVFRDHIDDEKHHNIANALKEISRS